MSGLTLLFYLDGTMVDTDALRGAGASAVAADFRDAGFWGLLRDRLDVTRHGFTP